MSFGGGPKAPAPLPLTPEEDPAAIAERKRKAEEAQRLAQRGGFAGTLRAGQLIAQEEQVKRAKNKLGAESG